MERLAAMKAELSARQRPALESKTNGPAIAQVSSHDEVVNPGIIEAFSSFVASKAQSIGSSVTQSLTPDRVKTYFFQTAFPLIAIRLPSLTPEDIADYNQIIEENRDATPQKLYDATRHIIEKVEIPLFDKISLPLSKLFDLFVTCDEDMVITDGQIDALIQESPDLDIVEPSSLKRTTIDLEGKKLSNHLSMRFIYNVAKTFLKDKLTDSFENIRQKVTRDDQVIDDIENNLSQFIEHLKESINEETFFGDFFVKSFVNIIIEGLAYVIHQFTKKAINLATEKTNQTAINRLSANTAIIGQLTHCLMQVRNVKNGVSINPGTRCIDIVKAQKEILRGDKATLKKEYIALTTRIIDNIDSLYKPFTESQFGKTINSWRSILANRIHQALSNSIFDHIANVAFNIFYTLATMFVKFMDLIRNFVAKKILILICNQHGTLEILAEKIEETLCDQAIIDPLLFELLGEINKACKKSSLKIRNRLDGLTSTPSKLTKEEEEIKRLLDTFLMTADHSENSLEKVLKKALGSHLSEAAYDAILKLLSKEVSAIYKEITTPSKIKSYLTKILTGVNTSLENKESDERSVIDNKIDAQLNDLATNLIDLGVSAASAVFSLPSAKEKANSRKNEIHQLLSNFKQEHDAFEEAGNHDSLEDLADYIRKLSSLQQGISDANARFPTSLGGEINKTSQTFLTSLHEQIKSVHACYMEQCARNISLSEKTAILEKTQQMQGIDAEDIRLKDLLKLQAHLELIEKPVCSGFVLLVNQWEIISEKTNSNIKALVLHSCIEEANEDTDMVSDLNMVSDLANQRGFETLALEIRKEFSSYTKKSAHNQTKIKKDRLAQIEKFKKSISKAKEYAERTSEFLKVGDPHPEMETKDEGINPALDNISLCLQTAMDDSSFYTDDAQQADNSSTSIEVRAQTARIDSPSVGDGENRDIEAVARSVFAQKAIQGSGDAISPQFRATVRNLLKFLKDPLFVTNLVRGVIIPSLDPKGCV